MHYFDVTMMHFQLLLFVLLDAVCAAAFVPHQVDQKMDNQSFQLHYDAVTPLSELRCTSYKSLLKKIPTSAQIVLIGEGTHGTEEFFRIRSELTKHLIQSCGFDAVICEGDVQPFYQLSKLLPADTIRQNLSVIFAHQFPDWMWNNVPMAEFVSWMHTSSKQRHLMGMDIQSPFASIDFIVEQLAELEDEEMMILVNECYETLNSFRYNIRKYGDSVYANKVTSQASNVQKVIDVLSEKHATINDCKTFELLHNVHVVAASEAYHRQRIFPGHSAAWNTRTKAFMDCILRLRDYVSHTKQRDYNTDESTSVKLVVWAHNSHVGDMRSVGYASQGQISLGQLCREKFGKDGVFLIGMTTYEGTVRAAHADRQGACWKGKGEVLKLRKGQEGSHEAHLHNIAMRMKQESGEETFGLNLRESDDIVSLFDCNRLERFVGSCYLPQTELMSHCTKCNLANQFDYVLHVDKSSAITV